MNTQMWLDLYTQATRISACIFTDRLLVYQSPEVVWDYSLPMYLAGSLPARLPDVWYAQSPENLFFGGLTLPEDGSCCGEEKLLLLGPVFTDVCTFKQAKALMYRLGRPESDAAVFMQRSGRIPAITVTQLCAHLRLLFQSFHASLPESVPMIDFTWSAFFPAPKAPIPDPAEEGPENGTRDELEDRLMSMVRHGKVRELRLFFNESPIYHRPDIAEATKDFELRRSYLIGACVLGSRVAGAAGADPVVTGRIASSALAELLRATHLHELAPIFQDFMLSYAKEMEKLHAFSCSDPVCVRIHHYISAHLYEKLSTSVIAGALHFTVPYISKRFRDVTGETITAHISEMKIREAAYLIDSGQYAPGEISALLQFSSQSYFIKVFRQHMDMTPEEYSAGAGSRRLAAPPL